MENLKQQLTELTADMDIPTSRRNFEDEGNIAWLARNLVVRNGDHPNYNGAMTVLRLMSRDLFSVKIELL